MKFVDKDAFKNGLVFKFSLLKEIWDNLQLIGHSSIISFFQNGNFKQNSMRNGVNSSQNANSSSGAQATFDFPLGISLGLLSLTKIF